MILPTERADGIRAVGFRGTPWPTAFVIDNPLANIPKFTPEKREIILDALHNNPTYSHAARKGRISRRTLWMWRRDNAEFAAECEAAREQGFEVLEDALITRGQKSDTTAAIFMLKGWKPERYAEKSKVEHSGSIDSKIEFVYQEFEPNSEAS